MPEVVILRLPQYLRILTWLLKEGIEVASSQHIGERLQVTPAQVRKDLSYFGRFGKQGRGYNVRYLINELKSVLGLDLHWNMAVVGVGRLGRAILSYPGFTPEGFHVVAAFDNNPQIVGQKIGDLVVRSMDDMPSAVKSEKIAVAVVAVPSEVAQQVIDLLVASGVQAILNYAPITAQVPDSVKIRNIDPVLTLQSMTYYLVGD